MERVLVTGGLGRSGRWIVDRLADDGHEVVCVDVDHPGWGADPRANVTFRGADLADRGDAMDLVAGEDPDAVVHWAAIPAPERNAGGRVYETNVEATYNVLVAAGRAGARVVQASSESAYGFPFAAEPRLPDELPITESHPLRPEDPYGLSKVVAEETAEMVVRRFGVPVLSVRPSWIQAPGDYPCRDLAADSWADGVGNFWSYVDARDVASLVAAGLDALADGSIEGHEAVHAAAADTYLDRSVVNATREVLGSVPDDCTLSGTGSALSTAKARRLLEWAPAHSWREAADEDVPVPSLVAE
jgi:nucleoside-diphosphate-sugar epimerase